MIRKFVPYLCATIVILFFVLILATVYNSSIFTSVLSTLVVVLTIITSAIAYEDH